MKNNKELIKTKLEKTLELLNDSLGASKVKHVPAHSDLKLEISYLRSAVLQLGGVVCCLPYPSARPVTESIDAVLSNLPQKLEKALEECIVLREKAFTLASRSCKDGAFSSANSLTHMRDMLSYLMDDEDNRSFEEWWNE